MKLTKEQQQAIFARLPELCYGVLNTTNELIIIKRGETGYYPTNYVPAEDYETAEKWCDIFNEQLGITKFQRQAMEMGSMFGWDIPGINPDCYYLDK